MSNFTVAEILIAAEITAESFSPEYAEMLTAYAERIKADEGALPVGLLTIELDRWYVEGIRMEIESLKVPAGTYELYLAPPAQAAQVDKCGVCDGPNTWDPESGVCRNCQDVDDAPIARPPAQPTKLEDVNGMVLVPREPTTEMVRAGEEVKVVLEGSREYIERKIGWSVATDVWQAMLTAALQER